MIRRILALTAVCCLIGGESARAAFLTTLFATNNGGAIGGAVYFDLNVANPNGITLTDIAMNTSIAFGTPLSMNVYTRPGTSTGFSNSIVGWTLASSGTGTAAGVNLGSMFDIGDIFLAPGITGFALHAVNFNNSYTNGNGANQTFSNSDLTFFGGGASNVLFTGNPFFPRVFNGTFTYNVGPAADPVPAPATIFALPAGLAVAAFIRRRRGATQPM